jgi:immunoglobulin-binding protein 1
MTDETDVIPETETLSQRFRRAVALIESDPHQSALLLSDCQEQVVRLALFSSNESIDEVATSSLPFLVLEHYLAMALTNASTTDLKARQVNLKRACDLWAAFLQRLERMDSILDATEVQHYEDLVELSSHEQSAAPPVSRDTKIMRHRAKQAAEQQRQRLEGLIERRSRLGVGETEDLDGHDHDSLVREVALTTLTICKHEAFDEWSNTIRELPMLTMMMERQGGSTDMPPRQDDTRTRPVPNNSQPLEVTRITQDAAGQLQIHKEQVLAGVFQPSWNQPTMSLEDFARREVDEAIQREARQKVSEANQQDEPRRYAQLLKDGKEDDLNLVEASAELDRIWDDWKDENPRGSGNKRGDVGDRNF